MKHFNPDLSGVKLLLLDIDGTISKWGSPELYPHFVEWMTENTELLEGLAIALITNQGGPACHDHFGGGRYPSLQQVQARLNTILSLMPKGTKLFVSYVFISKKDGSVYKPFGIAAENSLIDATRRKPSPAMLFEAMATFKANPDEVLYVGDRDEDEEASQKAGVRFYRVEEGVAK